MKVVEVVRNYNLWNFDKHYKNQYGESRNLIPLNKLTGMEVKSVYVNFPSNIVEITIIEKAE